MSTARLETQFGRTQGLELLRQLQSGELDYDQLVAEAEESKKKARKLRQVKALIAIIYNEDLPYLLSLLNNEKYRSFAIDSEGRLIAKRHMNERERRLATVMRF